MVVDETRGGEGGHRGNEEVSLSRRCGVEEDWSPHACVVILVLCTIMLLPRDTTLEIRYHCTNDMAPTNILNSEQSGFDSTTLAFYYLPLSPREEDSQLNYADT